MNYFLAHNSHILSDIITEVHSVPPNKLWTMNYFLSSSFIVQWTMPFFPNQGLRDLSFIIFTIIHYLVLSRMLIFILLRLRTKNPKNKNKYILFPSENIIMKIFSSYISNIKAENMINRELYIYNICIYHTETRLLFKEN